MTDTTKTREQLVTMALDNLQVTEVGQTPSDDDYDKVDERLDGLLINLDTRDICSIGDDSAIPSEFTSDLALLLANQAAPVFGRASSDEGAIRLIEDRLQVLSRKRNPSKKYLQVDTALQGKYHYTFTNWQSGQ